MRSRDIWVSSGVKIEVKSIFDTFSIPPNHLNYFYFQVFCFEVTLLQMLIFKADNDVESEFWDQLVS